MSSNFNGWMLECVIACCDEVTESSMKDKRAIGNKLKTWVTESSLQIEAKGKDQITARNHSKWIYTTNDRVPIILEEGDRRYSVIQPETRTVDNPALDGVPARVEGFALDRSSTEAAEYFQSVADYLGLPCRVPYNPWVPLETAAKAELLADGRQGTESFWADWAEEAPAGQYRTGLVYVDYMTWAGENGCRVMDKANLIKTRPSGWQVSVHKVAGKSEKFLTVPGEVDEVALLAFVNRDRTTKIGTIN